MFRKLLVPMALVLLVFVMGTAWGDEAATLKSLLVQADIKFLEGSDGQFLAPWQGDEGDWDLVIVYDEDTGVIVTFAEVGEVDKDQPSGDLAIHLLEINATMYPVKVAYLDGSLYAVSGVPGDKATPELVRYACEAVVAMADAVKPDISPEGPSE